MSFPESDILRLKHENGHIVLIALRKVENPLRGVPGLSAVMEWRLA